MPRFLFSEFSEGKPVGSYEAELPGPEEAKAEAVAVLGLLIKENPDRLWRRSQYGIELADENGSSLGVISATAMPSTRR